MRRRFHRTDSPTNEVVTPNMDKLGTEGVIFGRHYNTTAICMASRATVMTGKFEFRHGCNFGKGNLRRKDWEQSYPDRSAKWVQRYGKDRTLKLRDGSWIDLHQMLVAGYWGLVLDHDQFFNDGETYELAD